MAMPRTRLSRTCAAAEASTATPQAVSPRAMLSTISPPGAVGHMREPAAQPSDTAMASGAKCVMAPTPEEA